MMVELRKCPFCGNADVILLTKRSGYTGRYTSHEFYILCDETSGGCGTSSGKYFSKNKAIEAWNRRADDGNDE